MAEETEDAPATGDPADDDPKGPDPDALGDAGKRALDAERQARREAEARLKELEPLAAKAKELEEAGKSELEKISTRASELEKDRDGHAAAALKLELALTAAPEGMEPAKIAKLARRITGSSLEEMAEDAKELFAEFASKPSPGDKQVREELRRVPIETGKGGKPDPAAMDDFMRRRTSD